MPRLPRISLPGYPHHVTQRCINREQVFFDDRDYLFMLECLKIASEKNSSKIWVYCLMPNHFHLLIAPEAEDSLSKTLHHATFRYAQYFNKKYERTGRLWQNRYYSSIIDAENYLWAVARYIETNPVRAALVKNPEEWRWSSAAYHLNNAPDELVSDSGWLPESLKENYRNFLSQPQDNTIIRKCTLSGRPLGNDSFLNTLETILRISLRPRPKGRPRK